MGSNDSDFNLASLLFISFVSPCVFFISVKLLVCIYLKKRGTLKRFGLFVAFYFCPLFSVSLLFLAYVHEDLIFLRYLAYCLYLLLCIESSNNFLSSILLPMIDLVKVIKFFKERRTEGKGVLGVRKVEKIKQAIFTKCYQSESNFVQVVSTPSGVNTIHFTVVRSDDADDNKFQVVEYCFSLLSPFTIFHRLFNPPSPCNVSVRCFESLEKWIEESGITEINVIEDYEDDFTCSYIIPPRRRGEEDMETLFAKLMEYTDAGSVVSIPTVDRHVKLPTFFNFFFKTSSFKWIKHAAVPLLHYRSLIYVLVAVFITVMKMWYGWKGLISEEMDLDPRKVEVFFDWRK